MARRQQPESDLLKVLFSASSPIGMYVVQDGRFALVNPRFEELVGYGKDELLGTPSLKLVHPEDRAMVREKAVSLLKGESSSPYEYRYIDKDGDIKWVTETVLSIQYQGRQAALGNFMDITTYRRSKQALEQSEQNYRSLVENTPDVIYTVDPAGRILSVNKASKLMFGFDPEEVIGRKFTEFFTRETLPRVIKDCGQLAQGMKVSTESLLVKKNGERCHIEFTLVPLLIDGELIRIQGITRDITQRKQAEAAVDRRNRELSALNRIAQLMSHSMNLEDILQNALDGVLEVMEMPVGAIYLVDENSGALSFLVHRGFSEEMTNLVGRILPLHSDSSFSGRVAKQDKVLVASNLAEQADEVYRPVLERSRLQFTAGIPLKSKGKTLGVISISDYRPRDLSDNEVQLLETIGGQIGVSIDNAKLFEKILAQSTAMESYAALITRAQDEERRRIARDLHDEMAQSLAALSLKIQGITRDMARDSKPPPAKTMQNLEQLRSGVDTVLESVRHFIHDLRPEVLDQMGLIPAIELLIDELAQEGINARMEITGTQQRLSTETEVALFRIAQEAVRNARKHSQATEIVVRIEFGTKTIRLIIADNGKGFKTPNMLSSFAIKGKLGLIGMNERARLLNGSFTVRSRIDHGTTITVEVAKTNPAFPGVSQSKTASGSDKHSRLW